VVGLIDAGATATGTHGNMRDHLEAAAVDRPRRTDRRSETARPARDTLVAICTEFGHTVHHAPGALGLNHYAVRSRRCSSGGGVKGGVARLDVWYG
jgi:hypothetical protein